MGFSCFYGAENVLKKSWILSVSFEWEPCMLSWHQLIYVYCLYLCSESWSCTLCSRVWCVAVRRWNITYPARSCRLRPIPYSVLHVLRLARIRIRSVERGICPIAAVCTVAEILSQWFSTFSLNQNLLQQFGLLTEPMGVARNLSWGTPEARNLRPKAKSGEGVIGRHSR